MKDYLRLGIVSFIFLFLELALIRYIGTEIRIFSYLSNMILLAIFVGAGLGMLISPISLKFTPAAILLILVLVQTETFNNITDLLSPLSNSFIWYQPNSSDSMSILIGFGKTLFLFFLILFAFVPIGQYIGAFFKKTTKTVWLYSVNIIASVIGMWVFYMCSYLNMNPIFLILASVFLLILLFKDTFTSTVILLSIGVIIFAANFVFTKRDYPKIYWSPYQKLTISPLLNDAYQRKNFVLNVNNVGYMGLLDLSKNFDAKLRTKNKLLQPKFDNQYNLPYQFKTAAPQNVLIIGGGGGNDAAGALRNAPKAAIIVIEIDPKIIEIGHLYHPEKPYSSSNVRVGIDDGRSFIKRTKKTFDIVVMGLADSHSLNSALNNIQLDNYLYTKESLQEIKKILAPDGMLFLFFEVQRPWIGNRLYKTIIEAFDYPPLVLELDRGELLGWGGSMFVVGKEKDTVINALEKNTDLRKYVDRRDIVYDTQINTLTDDWPYLYLDKKRLPVIHVVISFMLISFIFLFKKKFIKSQPQIDFFLLGAGFLLFEFQNISKTSLLFGNTWVTNLFTITGALIFILLANLAYVVLKPSLKIPIILLLFSFAVQIFLPISIFNNLSYYQRIAVSSFMLNLPFFASGLLFISLLSKTKNKTSALAYNFIGSAFGGVMSVLSYLIGIQSILLISFLFYLVSLINITIFRSFKLGK